MATTLGALFASALDTIAQELADALAPLSSVYFNNAKIDVEFRLVDETKPAGYEYFVYGPAHLEIFVPTMYESFPVNYIIRVEPVALPANDDIDVSQNKHGIFP